MQGQQKKKKNLTNMLTPRVLIYTHPFKLVPLTVDFLSPVCDVQIL